MNDVILRTEGCAGRITLNRPAALNALTPEMCVAITSQLEEWSKDAGVAVVILDAEGEKAFCAGGDIAQVYAEGIMGNAAYAQDFWRAEYHMNATIARFPKPVISFMQGFVMGGGVGVGCHAHIRVVDHSAKVAMPECAIGLVTDVGGTHLLARAPGACGAYLAATAYRMGASDALYARFADHVIARDAWPALVEQLTRTGETGAIPDAAEAAAPSNLQCIQASIDAAFAAPSLSKIVETLEASDAAFAQETLKFMAKNDPLAIAASLTLIARAREGGTLEEALENEFRFTFRAVQKTDFLEGIRARIIDRDNTPHWTHSLRDVPKETVDDLLRPLGLDALWPSPTL